MMNYTLDIFRTVWMEQRVPQEWRDALLVPIPKTGDLTQCDNWQGISSCQENALGRLKILTLSKLSLPLCGRKSSPVSGGFVSRFKVCGGVHVSYIPLRR